MYTFWLFLLVICFLNVLWFYSVLHLCVVSKPWPSFVSSCVAHVYICTTVGTLALSITLFLSCAIIIMTFAFECRKWHFFGWEEVECFQFEYCLISFSYTKFVSESRKQIWFLCLSHMHFPLQAVGSDHWCVSSHCWWPAASLIIVSTCLLFMEVKCPPCHCALMHHTPQTSSKHCESYWFFFLHKVLILVYEQWLVLTWYLTWKMFVVHFTVLFCGTWTVVAAVEYTAFSGKAWKYNCCGDWKVDSSCCRSMHTVENFWNACHVCQLIFLSWKQKNDGI